MLLYEQVKGSYSGCFPVKNNVNVVTKIFLAFQIEVIVKKLLLFMIESDDDKKAKLNNIKYIAIEWYEHSSDKYNNKIKLKSITPFMITVSYFFPAFFIFLLPKNCTGLLSISPADVTMLDWNVIWNEFLDQILYVL